eukprot:3326606-Rhodomonas_salina.4
MTFKAESLPVTLRKSRCRVMAFASAMQVLRRLQTSLPTRSTAQSEQQVSDMHKSVTCIH